MQNANLLDPELMSLTFGAKAEVKQALVSP